LGRPKLLDTVWVPRILWALEWIRVHEPAGSSANAARIAEVFSKHGGSRIEGTNVARAFREDGPRMLAASFVVEVEDQLYCIGEAGTVALRTLGESRA
jgi:hypothetical protein